MSELAYFRGSIPSGWSGRGGQCKSAYHPIGSPSGSSSGSGVAASVGLATVTLGTETDGSILLRTTMSLELSQLLGLLLEQEVRLLN